MIFTLTMNPAIDRTIHIDHLLPGELNHVLSSRDDLGGKGINVSSLLRSMGATAPAVSITGTAPDILPMAEDMGLTLHPCYIRENIRINTKLMENGRVTELNEYGPTLTQEELHSVKALFLSLVSTGDIAVLSGSLPRGVAPSFYKEMIISLHEKGALVILDASGEALRLGIEAVPDIIKPNDRELSEYFYPGEHKELDTEEIISCADRLIQSGIKTVVVSLGGKGAVFADHREALLSPALDIPVASTVGAGDSMVAALAVSLEKGSDLARTATLCMAASAAACTTPGTTPPEGSLIEELCAKVKLLCYSKEV